MVESLADELEAAAEASLEEMLTLAEAAETSGYAYSSLERMVRRGELPNAGAKGNPRIRRRDLPRRPPHEPPMLSQNSPSGLWSSVLVRYAPSLNRLKSTARLDLWRDVFRPYGVFGYH